MKRVVVLVLVSLSTLLILLPAPAAHAAAPVASWTYAIYANEDNDLEYTWWRYTLPDLRAIPASTAVNVVAMVDWSSVGKGVQLLKFSAGKVTVIASWPDKDFGSGNTFKWFLQQINTRFPAQHLAVDICDHGYGWRYVSWDETSQDQITMPQLRAAIRNAGVPLDILAFDACNMADLEVAYDMSLTGRVKYMVGSEETVDQDGFAYGAMLAPLVKDPSITPKAALDALMTGWNRYYRPLHSFNWVSLSAIDLTKVRAAKADILAWTTRLRADLPKYRARYAADLHHSIYALESWQVDAADFATRLAADSSIGDATLRTLSTTVADDLRAAVLAKAGGSFNRWFTGMTIWWGTGGEWLEYRHDYYTQSTFGWQFGWYAFLAAYNAGHLPGLAAWPGPALPRATYGLTDVVFADATRGWAVGYNNILVQPVILRTVDGGRHWTNTAQSSWDNYMWTALTMTDPRHLWASGLDGWNNSPMARTTDGGAHWIRARSITTEYFLDVNFTSSTNGWTVGTDGTVLHTTDGGRHWSGTHGASHNDWWTVTFADAGHGWLAGGDIATMQGVIRRTDDDGATWTTQKTVDGALIYKVRAISASEAWAVGGDPAGGGGVILHTADAGQTWQVQYGGPAVPWLDDVKMIDATDGWAVGEHATVLHTTDGHTWNPVTVPVTMDLTSVWFIGTMNGWIVGDGEPLLQTVNGGISWTEVRADVVGPITHALAPRSVQRGHTVVLRCRVYDARSATAVVSIVVRTTGGKWVKTIALGRQATGRTLYARFVCWLPRGAYRYVVVARDESGNAQRTAGFNSLVVW
jgi:photosystem II stability/assembly factor-like uncharacterized protein